MRKRLPSFLLALVMIFSVFSVMTISVSAADSITPEGAYTVSAPDKDINAHFWLDEGGTPHYNIFFKGEALVENSNMGLAMNGIDHFMWGLTLESVSTSSANEEWSPISSDRSTVLDKYNMSEYVLSNGKKTITVQIRAYNTGVAFRFILPQGEYTISGEASTAIFPAGAVAYCHVGGNQTYPERTPVENFASTTYRKPMTFEYPSGAALTLCEANVDNYASYELAKECERGLYFAYGNVVVDENGPTATPWRVFVIGDNIAQLNENSDIVLNLNDEPDEEKYHFSDWVKAGSAIRAMDDPYTFVDFAAENGIQYVLIDTGWYGAEFDKTGDPRLDPSLLEEDNYLNEYIVGDGHFVHPCLNRYGKNTDKGDWAVDYNIPKICEYANSKNIGIILYVNGVFFPDDRFTPDELFARFEEWGVAGVKPGFVNHTTQVNENVMLEVIEAAANHQLIMTIHDEYVPAGIERTFPNVLATEGIAGDETFGNTANHIEHDITTLFTRQIQGPTDHTFCFPGKATKAYALASAICFKSGLNVLHWYLQDFCMDYINEALSSGRENIDIWKNLPGKYDEVKVIEGKAYGYATFARRSGTTWYIGSMNAEERLMEIPLDFLDEDKTYVAEIWADEVGADAYAEGISFYWESNKTKQVLEHTEWLVDSESVLARPLAFGQGYAARIHVASEDEIATLEKYNTNASTLKAYIEKAELLSASDYSKTTWVVLEKAVNDGKAILDNIDAYTDSQVEEAIAAITTAEDNLFSLKDYSVNAFAGEQFEIPYTTDREDIVGFLLYNENGKMVTVKKATSEANSDGTTAWTVSTSVGTSGSRALRLVPVSETEGCLEGIEIKAYIEDVAAPGTIIEAGFEKAAVKKNVPVNLNVHSARGVGSVTILNEKGMKMGKTLESKVARNDGTIDWTYGVKIGTVGERKFNILANNKAETAASVSIIVVQ